MSANPRVLLLGLAALALIITGAGFWWGQRQAHQPIITGVPPARRSITNGSSAPVSVPSAPQDSNQSSSLVVDVDGAVRRPGVYTLPAGARVIQALHAAGGTIADADLDDVDRAERVADGEKVFVPFRSKEEAAAKAAKSSRSRGRSKKKAGKMTSGTVSLNSATAEQLEELPGVGPGTAQKIITFRRQHGGFQNVDELLEIPGLSPKKYSQMSPFLTP